MAKVSIKAKTQASEKALREIEKVEEMYKAYQQKKASAQARVKELKEQLADLTAEAMGELDPVKAAQLTAKRREIQLDILDNEAMASVSPGAETRKRMNAVSEANKNAGAEFDEVKREVSQQLDILEQEYKAAKADLEAVRDGHPYVKFMNKFQRLIDTLRRE